jgi:pyridoxamine 5'-phosphate oxidase
MSAVSATEVYFNHPLAVMPTGGGWKNASLGRTFNAVFLTILRTPITNHAACRSRTCNWLEQATGVRAGGRLRKFFVTLYKAMLMLFGAAPPDVNAMTLATTDEEGRPSARIVLLKGVDERGFIFFTNYESRKAQELTGNPQAALVFYWPDLERQVCVAGEVSRLPQRESQEYFATRPRGSKLAAWASKQSDVVTDRAYLEKKWKELETQYPSDVPMPAFWGGYVLYPTRIEFWQGRPSRLHDRFRYLRQPDKSWRIDRLAP